MELLTSTFFSVIFVGIMLYGIIYMILKKMAFFGDERVSALIAFLAAVIVSFSGIITYIVSYAITWFSIILIVIFFVLLILMFLGVEMSEIKGMLNTKILIGIFGALFLIILVKGFFGVNNTFDLNEPQEGPYNVSTEFNTGVDDITNVESDNSWFENLSFDSELIGFALFFLLIGGAIFFIG